MLIITEHEARIYNKDFIIFAVDKARKEVIGEVIFYDRPEKTMKKSSWLITVSCVVSSFIFTVWGGFLLLGCLLYIAYSNHKVRNLLIGSGSRLLQMVTKKRGFR